MRLFPIKLFLGLLVLFGYELNAAAACSEEQKIQFLIQRVEKLDGTFVRNGEEHSPKDAADHLRMKLKKGQNSLFAPSKEKWTADMFIDKLASKSSVSGKDYEIRVKGQDEIKAKDWMRAQVGECQG